MAGDRPGHFAHDISSAYSIYLFKNLQVVILPLLARVAWKRLQIGRDMLLIITSNIVTNFLLV